MSDNADTATGTIDDTKIIIIYPDSFPKAKIIQDIMYLGSLDYVYPFKYSYWLTNIVIFIQQIFVISSSLLLLYFISIYTVCICKKNCFNVLKMKKIVSL